MASMLIAIAFPILVTWGIYAARPMFSRGNRPAVFDGFFGDLLFKSFNLIIWGSQISGIIWVFMTFEWWKAAAIVIGGVLFGAATFGYFGVWMTGSAIGVAVSAIGLSWANWIAWG